MSRMLLGLCGVVFPARPGRCLLCVAVLLHTIAPLAADRTEAQHLAEAARPSAAPQQRQDERLPVYEGRVDMVMLSVTVTNSDGVPVTGLTRDDFVVREDGSVRDVVVVLDPTDAPIDLALLMDFSGSMQDFAEEERRNALALLDQLSEDDCVYYQPFEIGLGSRYWGSPRDPRLRELVSAAPGESGTALYDAVAETMFRLQYDRKRCDSLPSSALSTRQEGTRRKALVVVTDGFDQDSILSFPHLLGAARQAEVPVFPVAVGPVNTDMAILRERALDDRRHRSWFGRTRIETFRFASQIRELAEATGGQMINGGATPETLREAYGEILRWLRASYAIGYYTEAVDVSSEDFELPVWYEVEVRVRPKGLSVHARPGYYRSPLKTEKSRLHVEAAANLLAEQKHSEALAELDFAIRADRYLWESYFYRGGALSLLGDLPSAQHAFLQAASLNPGHGRAHELACLASLEMEDYEVAWEQAIRAHQAGIDMTVELEQLRQLTAPPSDLEDRLSARRISIVADLPADPRTQAAVRRVLRQIRSAFADSLGVGLTDNNDLAEYLLLISSEGWARENLRDVKVKLSLAAREGEGVESRRMTLATLDDQEHVSAQIERYVRALEAWLLER